MAPTLSLSLSLSLSLLTGNCVGKSADYFSPAAVVVAAAAAMLKRHQRGEQLNLHVVSIFTIIK